MSWVRIFFTTKDISAINVPTFIPLGLSYLFESSTFLSNKESLGGEEARIWNGSANNCRTGEPKIT
jgi:hypothetical protein